MNIELTATEAQTVIELLNDRIQEEKAKMRGIMADHREMPDLFPFDVTEYNACKERVNTLAGIKEKIQPTRMEDTIRYKQRFNEGFDAYGKGIYVEECPYIPGPDREGWVDGYYSNPFKVEPTFNNVEGWNTEVPTEFRFAVQYAGLLFVSKYKKRCNWFNQHMIGYNYAGKLRSFVERIDTESANSLVASGYRWFNLDAQESHWSL